MVESAAFAPTMDRGTRKPQHRFLVQQHHWEIQPICIAPVLPGETLKALSIQARGVSSPIKSRVVGCWVEYFFFYVPFRQMADATNLVAMFISPTTTLSASAAAAQNYFPGVVGYDFLAQCKDVIIREWFRREGELVSSFVIRANRPAASIGIDSLSDSLIDSTVLSSGGAVTGLNIDDVTRSQMMTEYIRQLQTMGGDGGSMDYEEVLSSYGVRLSRTKGRDRPELIRYIREWMYPTNTVEPTTGVATTAWSWSVADTADKPRAFPEPGFVCGFSVVRPKVYFANQTAYGASMLDRAQRWLPPMMDESVALERALAEFVTTTGPFGKPSAGFTNGYWLDTRDLLNHGDQYIDATGNDAAPIIGLPTIAQQTRYASLAQANSLNVTADTYSVQDGAVSLQFATRVVEPS